MSICNNTTVNQETTLKLQSIRKTKTCRNACKKKTFNDPKIRRSTAVLLYTVLPTYKEITNGTRSTVKMLPGSVLLCPRPVPGLLGWAYPEQLGLSLTACRLMLGDSIRPCTNGVSLLHRIASVAPLIKPYHVLIACPIHRAPHGARGLMVLDHETRCWLNDITASI